MDKINGHFDKLLLSALILIFAVAAFRGFQVGSVGLENFGSDTTKLFAGALLTLITGSVLSKKQSTDTLSVGSDPNKSATTTTTSTTEVQK